MKAVMRPLAVLTLIVGGVLVPQQATAQPPMKATGLYNQGETYYLVFENPDNWIRSGSEVTVLLGAVEARHITVQ